MSKRLEGLVVESVADCWEPDSLLKDSWTSAYFLTRRAKPRWPASPFPPRSSSGGGSLWILPPDHDDQDDHDDHDNHADQDDQVDHGFCDNQHDHDDHEHHSNQEDQDDFGGGRSCWESWWPLWNIIAKEMLMVIFTSLAPNQATFTPLSPQFLLKSRRCYRARIIFKRRVNW